MVIKNNIGQIENIYSQDGKTKFQEYDFKNNVLTLRKQFTVDYQNKIDWNENVNLQNEEFITQTTYDALNRPLTITQPDNTVASYVYNKGGLLEQVIHDTTRYISNINYNEKGQREEVYYGNNTKTKSFYDAKTFRLKRLLTTRNNGVDIMQDLNYTFDAVGNIVQQNDNAQQTHYYSNQVIAPNCTYTYDPLYRLINATGRELTSLAMPTNEDFANNIGVHNTAANAMQNYDHSYVFDELGNMQSDNWKDYVYDTDTNRLLKHDPYQTLDDYMYDVHGNMLTMPHLTSMVWDFADRLQSAGNGTFTSYYNYDLGGNRSRKVVVKSNVREERYYMGDYEIYRKYINEELDTERCTVHIIDDRDRFAMIETETGNTPVVRYQYNNHLCSACLELDTTAAIISYEEYHPYGTTSYRSGRTETEASLKRYKYVGKERDEETGLYYYGARYYAAWLCRFVSVDPLQFKYPIYTPYQYAGNKPITYIDLDGLEEATPMKNSELTSTGYTSAQDNARAGYSGKSLNDKFVLENTIKIPTNNGTCTTTPSNLEKWSSVTIAPETETMIKYDPFIKAIAVGGVIYMGGVAGSEVASTITTAKTASATLKVLEIGSDFKAAYASSEYAQLMAGAIYAFVINKMAAGPDPGAIPGMSTVPAEYVNQSMQLLFAYYEKGQTEINLSTDNIPAQNNTKSSSNSYKNKNTIKSSSTGVPYKNIKPYQQKSILSTFHL